MGCLETTDSSRPFPSMAPFSYLPPFCWFFYNIPINASKVISHIPWAILENDQTQQTNNLELWFTFEIGGCSLKLNSKYVRYDLNPVGIVWNWMIFRISVPIFWRTGFWEETLTHCLKISKFNFVNFDLFIIFSNSRCYCQI